VNATRPYQRRIGGLQRVCEQRILLSALALAASLATTEVSAAEDCPTPADDIEVDRPDVTNSSLVVPLASLQLEDGINLTRRSGATIVDGTNSRLRLGIAHCLEVLVDVPDYARALRGTAPTGQSDVVPALKRQLGPLPADIELSATIGLGLPTGAVAVSGPGYQPYLQFPWSHPVGAGWSLNGMLTSFWFPSQSSSRETFESTLSLEREIGSQADLFVEFVGDYPTGGASSALLNMGGAIRVTPVQQLDFHTGFGLNDRAPRAFFGIGYSWRWDGL
jgi:hypothetical protein